MRDLHLPWLELSIFCPLVAALFSLFVRNQSLNHRIALVASTLSVFFTVGEWLDFGTLGSFSAQDRSSLIRWIFGRDFFLIDELSAPLMPMTAVLFALIIATTMRSKAGRFSFGLTMLAEAIILATLSCTNAALLIVLLLVSAILPWLELRSRRQVTTIYTAYLSVHIGLLAIGTVMLSAGSLPAWANNIAAIALVLSALIRAGIFPAHSWIIDFFERAPLGTAVLFVSPMTGAYVVMRLVLPMVPVWALHVIAVLSLITAVYAAGMAVIQVEGRRFYAFLFLSHSSLVLAGLVSANPIGMAGALCIWLALGISLGGFAIALRSVESRIGRISLDQYHGLFEHVPFLGSLFLLTGLASIGFPGGLAFIGMELLVEGTVDTYPLVGTLMVLAAALNGVAVMRAYFRIFTGTRHVATISLASRPAERFAVVTLSLLILATGVWPAIAVKSRYHAAASLLKIRQRTGADPTDADEQRKRRSVLDSLLQIDHEEEEHSDGHEDDHSEEHSEDHSDEHEKEHDERHEDE